MAFLIFITLVFGYVACRIHPDIKYSIYRYGNQQLYLKVAQYGLYCSLLPYGLIWFSLCNSNCMCILLGYHQTQECEINIALVSITLALGMLLTALIIKFFVEVHNTIDAIYSEQYEQNNIDALPTKIYDRRHMLTLFLEYLLFTQLSNTLSVLASMKGEPINTAMYKTAVYDEGFVAVKLGMKDGNSYTGFITDMGVPTETGGVDHSLSMMIEMPDEEKNTDFKVIHLRQENISSVTVVQDIPE